MFLEKVCLCCYQKKPTRETVLQAVCMDMQRSEDDLSCTEKPERSSVEGITQCKGREMGDGLRRTEGLNQL